jgi:signal peptidase I
LKILFKIINVVFFTVIFILLISSIGTSILNKPFLFSAIRSNSMYPILQKGDLVLINPISGGHSTVLNEIIVFKTENDDFSSRGWIIHRAIGGDARSGYITKGDANENTDQFSDNVNRIKPEWIVGHAFTVGSYPVKLPLIGNLSLLMEKYKEYSKILLIIMVFIAVVIGFWGERRGKRSKGEKGSFYLYSIFFLSGLIISVMLIVSMLASSKNMVLQYEVSQSERGAISGNTIGVMKTGDIVERPFLSFNNTGLFPIIYILAHNDNQISFSQQKICLMPGQKITPTIRVKAISPGKFKSTIRVGMFLPILPEDSIAWLVSRSYWLALAVISLIPGLPLMLYPLFDSRLRRKLIKGIRFEIRRLKAAISL